MPLTYDTRCVNVTYNRGNVSILTVLRQSTSRLSLYKRTKWVGGSGHRIFYRLALASGIANILNHTNLESTLFVPNDLSMLTSARDLKQAFNLSTSIRSYTEARKFLLFSFPAQFQNSSDVLRSIVENHFVSKKYALCSLFEQQTLSTWAHHNITRSGISLYSDNGELLPPQIDISKIPVSVGRSIIYAVDRLLLPELSDLPRRNSTQNLINEE